MAAKAAVREAIERNGEARFRSIDTEFYSEYPVRDLLGYRKTYRGEPLWCFTSSDLKQVLNGIARIGDVVPALYEAGLLIASPSDRSHRLSVKVDGRVVHTYAIRDSIVAVDETVR